MKEFHCKCGWTWIVTKTHVFGPIDIDGIPPRIRMREDWDYEYGDCSFAFKKWNKIHKNH